MQAAERGDRGGTPGDVHRQHREPRRCDVRPPDDRDPDIEPDDAPVRVPDLDIVEAGAIGRAGRKPGDLAIGERPEDRSERTAEHGLGRVAEGGLGAVAPERDVSGEIGRDDDLGQAREDVLASLERPSGLVLGGDVLDDGHDTIAARVGLALGHAGDLDERAIVADDPEAQRRPATVAAQAVELDDHVTPVVGMDEAAELRDGLALGRRGRPGPDERPEAGRERQAVTDEVDLEGAEAADGGEPRERHSRGPRDGHRRELG